MSSSLLEKYSLICKFKASGFAIKKSISMVTIQQARPFTLMMNQRITLGTETYLVTFSSTQHSSQINLLLTRRMERRACLGCKVIPKACVVAQHKLVVTKFRFHACFVGTKVSKSQENVVEAQSGSATYL
jgi:hypothetical protein